MKKCDFLKTLQWPDFETLWGNQGHNNVKHGINGSSGTFFFSGGLLRPVVWGITLFIIEICKEYVDDVRRIKMFRFRH